jgi:hypothetical protein
MHSQEDVLVDVSIATQRGIGGQHREIPGAGVMAEGRMVVEQHMPANTSRVTDDRVGAENRAATDASGGGDDGGGVDEREKHSAAAFQRFRHPATRLRDADRQQQAVVGPRFEFQRISDDGERATARHGRLVVCGKKARQFRPIGRPGIADPLDDFATEASGPNDENPGDGRRGIHNGDYEGTAPAGSARTPFPWVPLFSK